MMLIDDEIYKERMILKKMLNMQLTGVGWNKLICTKQIEIVASYK